MSDQENNSSDQNINEQSRSISKKKKTDSENLEIEMDSLSDTDDSLCNPANEHVIKPDKSSSSVGTSTLDLDHINTPNAAFLSHLELLQTSSQYLPVSSTYGGIYSENLSDKLPPSTSIPAVDDDDNGQFSSSDTTGFDENEQKAAEDIVRKLCRNGKLMEFQEGEDFIKVIVYEDSQEEDNDDQSEYEDEEIASFGRKRKQPGKSRNLLECLTEPGKENKRGSKVFAGSHSSALNGHPKVLHDCQIPNIAFPVSAGNAALLGNQVYNTPHPRNGYMLYTNSQDAASRQCVPRSTPGMTPVSSRMKTPGCKTVQLNSSGEEISPSDPVAVPTSEQIHNRVRSLMHLPQFEEDTGKVREQHNQKERRRRARIKEACNLLRQLVPGMSDKTDKATVFEFAARYVHFLKSHTGAQYDKDFLMKYSPY